MGKQKETAKSKDAPVSKGTIESTVVGVSDEKFTPPNPPGHASPDDFVVDQARRLAEDTPQTEPLKHSQKDVPHGK